jgi:hypothetical protein
MMALLLGDPMVRYRLKRRSEMEESVRYGKDTETHEGATHWNKAVRTWFPARFVSELLQEGSPSIPLGMETAASAPVMEDANARATAMSAFCGVRATATVLHVFHAVRGGAIRSGQSKDAEKIYL